jgi:hypothetical protein
VDVLAVGEPIGLASLSRITDPAAVEEADMGGLITLETGDAGVEVWVAHPLYGEVRRERVAPTRLRRLRGLVATELAKSDDCDDVRVVVRRATLSLDSDLEPDPDLLIRAARAPYGSPISRWPIDWLMRQSAPAGPRRRISFVPMFCRGSAAARRPMRCWPARPN